MPKPETLLPLKPLVFDVLLILNEAERHGYGIAKELQERSPGGRRILPGNLYRTLSGMIARDLIEKSPRRDGATEEDERRATSGSRRSGVKSRRPRPNASRIALLSPERSVYCRAPRHAEPNHR